jgi:hypothetical protein
MQVFVISVQNAVSRAHIGSATALTQFSRQIGATIGVTVIGTIVNHGLPAGVSGGDALGGIHRLPHSARVGLAAAIRPGFIVAASVSLVVWVVAVFFVKEQPLRRTLDDVSVGDAAAGAAGVPARAAVDSEP